jgi:hypothetical protein
MYLWRPACILFSESRSNAVILYALLAAVFVLVAVTFISSLDFPNTRRR